MSSSADLEDGCAGSEKIRKFAFIWTIATAIIALALVKNLSGIDRYMYDSKGKYIDSHAHAENRLSATSLPVESVDGRKLSSPTFVQENHPAEQ